MFITRLVISKDNKEKTEQSKTGPEKSMQEQCEDLLYINQYANTESNFQFYYLVKKINQ